MEYNQELCSLLLPVAIKFYFLHVHTEAKKLFSKGKLEEIRLIHLAGTKSLSDFKNSYTSTKEKSKRGSMTKKKVFCPITYHFIHDT